MRRAFSGRLFFRRLESKLDRSEGMPDMTAMCNCEKKKRKREKENFWVKQGGFENKKKNL
jgi:hypothetical protein